MTFILKLYSNFVATLINFGFFKELSDFFILPILILFLINLTFQGVDEEDDVSQENTNGDVKRRNWLMKLFVKKCCGVQGSGSDPLFPKYFVYSPYSNIQ